MGDVANLNIIITPEFALLWFSAMVVCSSLAIMSSAFLFQHYQHYKQRERKGEIKNLLGYFTSSARSFFISGVAVVVISGLQVFSEPEQELLTINILTPIFLGISGIFFIFAAIGMFSGLNEINRMYEIEEEENPDYLNKYFYAPIKEEWQLMGGKSKTGMIITLVLAFLGCVPYQSFPVYRGATLFIIGVLIFVIILITSRK